MWFGLSNVSLIARLDVLGKRTVLNRPVLMWQPGGAGKVLLVMMTFQPFRSPRPLSCELQVF